MDEMTQMTEMTKMTEMNEITEMKNLLKEFHVLKDIISKLAKQFEGKCLNEVETMDKVESNTEKADLDVLYIQMEDSFPHTDTCKSWGHMEWTKFVEEKLCYLLKQHSSSTHLVESHATYTLWITRNAPSHLHSHLLCKLIECLQDNLCKKHDQGGGCHDGCHGGCHGGCHDGCHSGCNNWGGDKGNCGWRKRRACPPHHGHRW